MAVYDVSFLDHTMGQYNSSEHAAMFEELQHLNGEAEYISSSQIKKENIDPEKGSNPSSGYPEDKMDVFLASGSDQFNADEGGGFNDSDDSGTFLDRPYSHSRRRRMNREASYFSKFCENNFSSSELNNEINKEQDEDFKAGIKDEDVAKETFKNDVNGVKEDTPIVKVCYPETSGECLQLVLNKPTTMINPKVFIADEGKENMKRFPHSKPECPEFLEASKAEVIHQTIDTKSEFGDFKSNQNGEMNVDEDELVYVEASQPLLPGTFDNIPLKFEYDNDDQSCTLGEVAEKIYEINVDDPYDLCSLLAAEKEKKKELGCSRRRRKMMYDYPSINNKSIGKNNNLMSLHKNKDLRISKLKAFKYPYKCSRCESWFVDSCDLKVHMSTHSAKSFKSVKEFIHEKIFKTSEIDKVIINAPIDYKNPVTTASTKNCKESKKESEIEIIEHNTHHNQVIIHEKKEPKDVKPDFVYANVKAEPCRQNGMKHVERFYEKHERFHREKRIVPPNIVYYEHVGHREWMPLNNDVTLACGLCNMQFNNISNLTIHMQVHNQIHEQVRSHKKVQNREPPRSNDPVHQKAALVSQLSPANTTPVSSNTPPSNPYKCTSCTASFGTSFNLKRHMRIHTGTRPYKCEQCQSAFITKAQLTTHMRTHTGEKPYQCDICGGKFIQQNNLKRHIMTHTGEKPFKCDKCSAAFISSSDLKRHIRVHTGEKPYKCVHCNKGFTTSGNLSSHYKMHTGEKPYKCQKCDASFSHQSNLKTHIKRHCEQPQPETQTSS